MSLRVIAKTIEQAALAALEATTAASMWLSDLGDFDTAWKKMRAERETALEGKAKVKAKKGTK